MSAAMEIEPVVSQIDSMQIESKIENNVFWNHKTMYPQYASLFDGMGNFIDYDKEGPHKFNYDMVLPEFRDYYDNSGTTERRKFSEEEKLFGPFTWRVRDALEKLNLKNKKHTCICTCPEARVKNSDGKYPGCTGNCGGCDCDAKYEASQYYNDTIEKKSITVYHGIYLAEGNNDWHADYSIKITETSKNFFTVTAEAKPDQGGRIYTVTTQHTLAELQYDKPFYKITSAIWKLLDY